MSNTKTIVLTVNSVDFYVFEWNEVIKVNEQEPGQNLK